MPPLSPREWIVATLTLSGAIPFVMCAIAHLIGYGGINPQMIASYWGFTILIFMAGTHWGIAIAADRMISPNMFVASNLVVLIVCGLLTQIRFEEAAMLFAVGFAVLLYFDREQRRQDQIDGFYYRLRLIVSAVVIASLVAVSLPVGGA